MQIISNLILPLIVLLIVLFQQEYTMNNDANELTKTIKILVILNKRKIS